MKRLLLAYLLVLPLFSFGQYKFLVPENGDVLFERVYNCDSLDTKSIERLLVSSIPKIKDLSDFVRSDGLITAKLNNSLVDYKKYGGKWATALMHLNHPMFGNVTIVWKDSKYRVTVSGMYWTAEGGGKTTSSEIFLKRNGVGLDQGKTIITAGKYVESYLSDMFYINPSQKTDW